VRAVLVQPYSFTHTVLHRGIQPYEYRTTAVAVVVLRLYTVSLSTMVLRETVLKYSSYWSTASPQLHGPKAKPDSASKLKALRGVVATQTELLKAGQSAWYYGCTHSRMR
jgi:hypothetical protein